MKNLMGFALPLNSMAYSHAVFTVVTAAIGLGSWYVIADLHHHLTDTSQRINEGQLLLAEAAEVHANARSLKERKTSVEVSVQSLLANVPDSPEETRFLAQLSDSAAENNISLGDFRPGSIVENEEFKEIELRLRGTGSYEQICRWLAGIRELPRVVRISQLTIAAPATVGGDCSVDIQMHLMFGLKSGRRPTGTLKS